MGTSRAKRRIGSRYIWITIAVALVVHGVLIETSLALGLSWRHPPPRSIPKPPPPLVADVELEAGCAGDAMLASVGRAALCLAPWSGADREQCAYDARMQMYLDLSSCSARTEATPTSIAMLEMPELEKKLPQIDAEKLLDEAKQLPEEQKQPEIPQPQQVQPPPPPPQQMPLKPAQIVETAKPDKEQPEPEDARYLSEHNTIVDKQKVNRGAKNEPMVAKAKPEELTPSDKPKDDPSIKEPKPDQPPGKQDAPPVPGSLAMRKPGAPAAPAQEQQEEKVRGSTGGAKGPTVADGYMGRKGDGAVEQQRREREEERLPPGQQGGGGGTPTVPNLKPTKEQLERALGGGNVDHVDDAEDGDETAFNSKRYVYADFFNRMKRFVAQNWEPQGVWRRVDPDGKVYGFKTRITEVRVALAPNGVLDKIMVTQASGVAELDDEAIRAFRASAPFPNPPEGLVKDGRISFSFSFYFEIGQPRSAWKVIRSM